MSVSDPSLKRLKQLVLSLRTADPSTNINDYHPDVEPLCVLLEDIFRRGFRRTATGIFASPKDYYQWLFDLPDLCHKNANLIHRRRSDSDYNNIMSSFGSGVVHPVYQSGIDDSLREKRINSRLGRARYLIRHCLMKKIIHWPVMTLINHLGLSSTYYDDLYSVMGNDILAQIFQSLLAELSKVEFHFTLHNASFLGDSWQLPRYKFFEFVPTKVLGLHLYCIEGHQVVERLLAGSVAAEDNKVEPGDIFDEVLNTPLKNSKINIRKMINDNAGWPVSAWFVKARLPDGSIYPPLMHLLKNTGNIGLLNDIRRPRQSLLADGVCGDSFTINLDLTPGSHVENGDQDLPIHARLEEDDSEDIPAANPEMGPSYVTRYVGSMTIGRSGGVDKIETGIADVLKQHSDPKEYTPCRIELGEKDVIVTRLRSSSSGDNRVLLQHAYPQISSCGRRVDCARFVAYIGGETTCTLAQDFTIFVFEARSDYESKTILCSIAQGFERTHWAL